MIDFKFVNLEFCSRVGLKLKLGQFAYTSFIMCSKMGNQTLIFISDQKINSVDAARSEHPTSIISNEFVIPVYL